MNMSIRKIDEAGHQIEPIISGLDSSADEQDPIQALLASLEGKKNVSNPELVNNLIALLRSVQSLIASLQEGQSKKASIDAEVQRTLTSMNEATAEALQTELDDYLKALEEYEKNKLVNDIFGAILPFLTLIFPPLLALYPLGPASLLLDPNAPFDMGVLGKEIEEKHGKGAVIGITVGLEVVATIVMTIFTCGATAAIRAGGEAGRAALKILLKEIVKDLALYATAKAVTSDQVLPHIIDGVIKMIEGMAGQELDAAAKAAIKAVVTLIVQIVLMVVAFKVKSNSSRNGSILAFFNKSVKHQAAAIAVMLVIQGAQSGIQMWAGMNTIETAKIQKSMREIRGIEMALKGIDAARKTPTQNIIKELQRYFATIEPRELDLEGVVGKLGSQAAKIISQ